MYQDIGGAYLHTKYKMGDLLVNKDNYIIKILKVERDTYKFIYIDLNAESELSHETIDMIYVVMTDKDKLELL